MTNSAPLIHFLGAAGTVTGSRFLVEDAGRRVLIDCGMFQGHKELRLRNWAPFPVDPASIDAVVITHAHLDHVGYLPALARDGFAGPVVCTPSTASLAEIVLEDSARLQEEEAGYANHKGYSKHHPALPLYTSADAHLALSLLRPVDLDRLEEVVPGVRVTLRNAGHILGSATATVQLERAGRTLLFSGDLGRPTHPLLRPPDEPRAVDVIVSESTYGDRLHEDEGAALDVLADAVTRTAERGGMVVIPAFAVDRTEVVLMALGRLAAEGRIPSLPVHADSPMALRVLDVYRSAIAEHAPDLRSPLDADPFAKAGTLHEAFTTAESRALNELHYPAILISASGMASGGRVLHHLAQRLPDHRNTVVLTGFQAAGTRGRQLADGARSVKLFGQYVPVRAEIAQVNGFSVHADAAELTAWLGRAPKAPDVAFLVHGEPESSAALRDRLVEQLDWNVAVPRLGERVRLDAAPRPAVSG